MIVNVPLPPLPLPSFLQCEEMHELRSVLNSQDYWISKSDVVLWCNKLNRLQTGFTTCIPALEHRLSDEFERRQPDIHFESRSPNEINALEISMNYTKPVDASDWIEWIITLNKIITNSKGGFRKSPIYTQRDKFGGFAVYPHSDLVAESMNHLSMYQGRFWLDFPIETAIVSLAFIGAIHPFSDGNGRTSRIVFNAISSSMDRNLDRYIPLHEIATHSRGGYILALREAQYLNNWKPLIVFLSESCKNMVKLVR